MSLKEESTDGMTGMENAEKAKNGNYDKSAEAVKGAKKNVRSN